MVTVNLSWLSIRPLISDNLNGQLPILGWKNLDLQLSQPCQKFSIYHLQYRTIMQILTQIHVIKKKVMTGFTLFYSHEILRFFRDFVLEKSLNIVGNSNINTLQLSSYIFQLDMVATFETITIFTARNEVMARLCFYTCLWLRSRGGEGWWYPTMPCRSPGPHPRGKLRGLAWGRGLQAHTGVGWGGFLQAHTGGGEGWVSPGPAPPPTPDGYCCGRYASYWNAFLLSFVILSNKTTVFKYAMSIYLIIYGLIFHDFSLWHFPGFLVKL